MIHRLILPIALAASLGATSAEAAGDVAAQVCGLLVPFLRQAPAHFEEMRGPQTSDKAWTAKPIPEAKALNAACNITTYVAGRIDLDCDTNFTPEQIVEQDEFFRGAVNGLDFCMGNLDFGVSVQRQSERSDSPSIRSETVSWVKRQEKDGRTGAQFGASVDASFFKSTKTRRVRLTLYFDQAKP